MNVIKNLKKVYKLKIVHVTYQATINWNIIHDIQRNFKFIY